MTEKKYVRVNLRLPENILTDIDVLADRFGTSRNSLLSMICAQYIENVKRSDLVIKESTSNFISDISRQFNKVAQNSVDDQVNIFDILGTKK